MRKTSLTIIAVCLGLLWLGNAHAARFETHAINPAVPAGTVYDTTTKLLWEMKTSSGVGGLHVVGIAIRGAPPGALPMARRSLVF